MCPSVLQVKNKSFLFTYSKNMNYQKFQKEVIAFLDQAYKKAMSEAIKKGKEAAKEQRGVVHSPCKRK